MIFLLIAFILIVSVVISHGMRWYENFLTPFWKPNGFLVGEFFGLVMVSSFLSFASLVGTFYGAYFYAFSIIFFSILGLIFLVICISFFALKKMLLTLLIALIEVVFLMASVFLFFTFSRYTILFLLPLFLWSVLMIYLSYRIYKFDVDRKESE